MVNQYKIGGALAQADMTGDLRQALKDNLGDGFNDIGVIDDYASKNPITYPIGIANGFNVLPDVITEPIKYILGGNYANSNSFSSYICGGAKGCDEVDSPGFSLNFAPGTRDPLVLYTPSINQRYDQYVEKILQSISDFATGDIK